MSAKWQKSSSQMFQAKLAEVETSLFARENWDLQVFRRLRPKVWRSTHLRAKNKRLETDGLQTLEITTTYSDRKHFVAIRLHVSSRRIETRTSNGSRNEQNVLGVRMSAPFLRPHRETCPPLLCLRFTSHLRDVKPYGR